MTTPRTHHKAIPFLPLRFDDNDMIGRMYVDWTSGGYVDLHADWIRYAPRPCQATPPDQPDDTASVLITHTRLLDPTDYRVSVRQRTNERLRNRLGAGLAKPWEIGQSIAFDMQPAFEEPAHEAGEHATWFMLKGPGPGLPNGGYQLSRWLPHDGEEFLITEPFDTAPRLDVWRVINVERRGEVVHITVPSLGISIDHTVPLTYSDGVRPTQVQVALYTEDAVVDCNGFDVS